MNIEQNFNLLITRSTEQGASDEYMQFVLNVLASYNKTKSISDTKADKVKARLAKSVQDWLTFAIATIGDTKLTLSAREDLIMGHHEKSTKDTILDLAKDNPNLIKIVTNTDPDGSLAIVRQFILLAFVMDREGIETSISVHLHKHITPYSLFKVATDILLEAAKHIAYLIMASNLPKETKSFVIQSVLDTLVMDVDIAIAGSIKETPKNSV